MSAKEDCFKEATEAYEDATGKDMGIEHQRPWRQLNDGSWERTSNWWSAINSFLHGNAAQIRRPDLTINGNTVVDLKFTRSDGTVDSWGTRPGAGNGNTQLDDYNDINQQNNPDFDNDDPKLDPESCNCDERGAEPVRVGVPVPAPFGVPGMVPFMPLPSPGGIPVLPGPVIPELPPILPGPVPMPFPVIP